MAVQKTDTKLKEFKILYPELDVEICGTTYTIKQWSALKAKDNAKKLQGPFIRLANEDITNDLLAEIYDVAFEEIIQIIAVDYGVSIESAESLPASEAVKAFKGIIEANLSFFAELSEVQEMVKSHL